MRAYTVAAAALALNVDNKWVDNVLSHHTVRGVQRKKQGIQRQIPAESLLILATAVAMIESLGVPIGRALEIAEQLTASRSASGIAVSADVFITGDLGTIAGRLNERLTDAVEGAAQRPRGRPHR